MVFLLGIDLGWLLIMSGALLLLVEVYSQFLLPTYCHRDDLFRYFIILGVDVFNSGWGVVTGVIIAICAAGFTVWMYREDHTQRKSDNYQP